jgi:hypothetical protein
MTTRNWQNRMSRTGERQLLEESDSLLVWWLASLVIVNHLTCTNGVVTVSGVTRN